MNAIKATRRTVMANPTGEDSRILTRFVLALGNETPFAIGDLCDLELATFEFAPQILVEWRRDKSCASRSSCSIYRYRRTRWRRASRLAEQALGFFG